MLHTFDSALAAAFSIAVDRMGTYDLRIETARGDGAHLRAFSDHASVQVTIAGAACDTTQTEYTIDSVDFRAISNVDFDLAFTRKQAINILSNRLAGETGMPYDDAQAQIEEVTSGESMAQIHARVSRS